VSDAWAMGPPEATAPKIDHWTELDAPRAHAEPPAEPAPIEASAAYEEPAPPIAPAGPVMALDGFAHGIDALDGLVVFSLKDGSLYGAWVRPDAGFAAEDVASTMREAYRMSLQASRRLAIFAAAATDARQAAEPIVTIETLSQTALLKRVRAFVVATLFDASMPLGMARLCAAKLSAALDPELPFTDLERLTLPPPPAPGARPSRPPVTGGRPARKASHAAPSEVEHVRRVIAYTEASLPDAHTVRWRLSLRAHTPRLAIDHPETLASDAILRVETAALEMLGIDREQLAAALEEANR
ncbi:MAG: hypothetical protein R3B70_20355, partial [Polyangiaceae bacterium]